MTSKSRFFISYRRADTASVAQRLHDRLIAAFADAQIFMDLHTIHPGDDFPEKIDQALRETDVVIALIGPEWLRADASGRRRIDDERDFVRIELATALELNVPVLPVLIGDDARTPSPEHLPLDIAEVSRRNAVVIHEATFDGDCDRLVDALRGLLRLGRHDPAKVPEELVALWVSTGMGDAILQYDIYPNGTYQHVGITRQEVPGGTFEFVVTHEGRVTVTGNSVTFAAYRARASRSHPESPGENYTDAPRRPETTTTTWLLQRRGSETFLVLGDGSGVVYRRFERARSSTRAAQTPVIPQTPAGAGETASGSLLDWFPLFGQRQAAQVNHKTNWKLVSTPGERIVYLIDPAGEVFDIDISGIERDGSFKPFDAEGGRRLPLEIGWYGGGSHHGVRRDGTYGEFTVAPGYYARWVSVPS